MGLFSKRRFNFRGRLTTLKKLTGGVGAGDIGEALVDSGLLDPSDERTYWIGRTVGGMLSERVVDFARLRPRRREVLQQLGITGYPDFVPESGRPLEEILPVAIVVANAMLQSPQFYTWMTTSEMKVREAEKARKKKDRTGIIKAGLAGPIIGLVASKRAENRAQIVDDVNEGLAIQATVSRAKEFSNVAGQITRGLLQRPASQVGLASGVTSMRERPSLSVASLPAVQTRPQRAPAFFSPFPRANVGFPGAVAFGAGFQPAQAGRIFRNVFFMR